MSITVYFYLKISTGFAHMKKHNSKRKRTGSNVKLYKFFLQ